MQDPAFSDLDVALRLAVAALAGLAVGLEREWSGHATGPSARFAGVRTFFLLGAVGGIAGWLSTGPSPALAVALIAVAGAFVVAAYVMAAGRAPEAIDGTTEAAAILILAVGIMAGRGSIQVASGLAAVMVLALGEKDTIRRFIGTIDAPEMRAALQFSVLALVVLPLLPAGPYGPLDAIRPRMIWTVVLRFSAVNFAGFLARKALGDHRGDFLTGALGGLISSTAVTLAFARASRRYPERTDSLALGTLAACTVLVPRVTAIILALNAGFVAAAAAALAPVFVVGAAGVVLMRPRAAVAGADGAEAGPRNPLDLGQALRMALAFQAVLMVITFLQVRFGEVGVLGGAALAGLTDVDALTLSMARIAGGADGGLRVAAAGLLVGVVANTALKTGLAMGLGSPAYRRRVAPGMMGLLAAGLLGLAIAWR